MPSIIVGLLAFAMGLWGLSVWWYSVEELLRGMVPLLLLLFGVVPLMAGVSRVVEISNDEKSDEELIDLDDEAVSDEPAEKPIAPVKRAVKKKRVVNKRVVKKTAEAGKQEKESE